MLIVCLLSVVCAKRKEPLETIMFTDKYPLKEVNLSLGGEIIAWQDSYSRVAIDLQVEHGDSLIDSICYGEQMQIVFGDYDQSSKIVFEPDYKPEREHVNDPSYFLDSPILLSMVHIKQGIVTVTSDHQLILYNVTVNSSSSTGFNVEQTKNISFAELRPGALQHSVPQLAYSPHTNYIYIIYQDQVIGGLIERDFKLRNITVIGLENNHNYLGTVKVIGYYLLAPVGSEGLDIYRLQDDGGLLLEQSLKTYEIFDKQLNLHINEVSVGGSQGNYLYVLDSNTGVARFIMKYNGTQIEFLRDDDFGYIPIYNGFALAAWQETILVLVETGSIQYLQEYGLDIDNTSWFKVKTHYLSGRYFSIHPTDEFTLLRGTDAHRIIFLGVYQEFQPDITYTSEDDIYKERANAFDEQYVFIPHLQSLEYYDSNFGFTHPQSWYFNFTHEFILAITSHRLVELPYEEGRFSVKCNTKARRLLGGSYYFNITANATNCQSKMKQLYKQDSEGVVESYPPQLILCQLKQDLQINIINRDGLVYNTEELVSIIIGLIVLLILLSFLLAYLYNKYSSKKDSLTGEISGLEGRGYEMEPNDQQNVGL